jgi:hypothetical protein
MKQAFRAQSFFLFFLLGISTLWGQQQPGHWRLVGSPSGNGASGPLTARIEPAESEVESGGSVKMKAIVSGGTPPYSYEWRNGDKLSPVTTAGIAWSDLNRLGDRDIRVIVRDAAGNTVEAHAAIHVHAGEPTVTVQMAPEPAAPSQPTTVSQELQTNRPGGDYRYFDLASADPALCQQQCLNESKCAAWTYVNPGLQGSQARCWLKSTIPGPTRDACCVSGTKEPNSPVQPSPQPSAPSQPTTSESKFFRTVSIAGTWQPGARGETWTFTALGGDRYKAVARGSVNATGIATVMGNRVRIDYTWQDRGEHTGYYQLTVDANGRKATGRFGDDRPQEGSITMMHNAGP